MNDDLDVLIEATVSAKRDRDVNGRVLPPPAWWDLPPDARLLVFDAQVRTRELERALDAEGFSGTVRAVLARLEG